MRLRPAVLLSTLALAAVSLAGCSGEPAPESTPSASAAGDLCGAALPDGDATDALEVTGEVGSVPEVAFEAPLEIAEPLRTVVTEGEGEPLQEGESVEYAMAIFDASNGELAQVGGFDETLLPLEASAASGVGQLLGCAPVGSRVAVTIPGSEQSAAAVYVIDVLGTADDVPARASGEQQDVPEGLPTVELSDEGAPTITLPDAEPPAETQVTTLIKGEGAVVESGDDVLVNYTGVKWSDGSVFDSSWDAGSPVPFNTGAVVAGFTKALEGQTVGSQVLVTMPPADGYGSVPGHELEKETLTFVLDILASGKPMHQP
ncbi:FKBP-type peptidyl-prolyl cis-trans isomerase [Microbacterium sp. NPDC096154]|uniref:FKBP-type peptidyl-prolyl cis-trans isomerase n=1 Tax=Microbacterium sp. NPDC096154 TaxID=3155549 RepID=UPI00333037CC